MSFPVQGETYEAPDGRRFKIKAGTIPDWLAEIAYDHYTELFGKQQTLERLGQRMGFGPTELLRLLRKENPCNRTSFPTAFEHHKKD